MSKNQLREATCDLVARLLAEERKRQRMSMRVLAKGAGLNQSMISLVERGLRNPTLDTFLRIADVLDVDLAEVLRKARKTALTGGPK